MSKNKHHGQPLGEPVTSALPLPAGGVQMETFVPWTLVKRGLRKQVITPLDAPQAFLREARAEQEGKNDTALMRALGLAFYWQRLLDEEKVASVTEIAEAEGIDVTQVRRLLRLTLLAPRLVESISISPSTNLQKLMSRLQPNSWSEQMHVFLEETVLQSAT
jgi:hypothetical protein